MILLMGPSPLVKIEKKPQINKSAKMRFAASVFGLLRCTPLCFAALSSIRTCSLSRSPAWFRFRDMSSI
jgi:hypothetical protein